MVIICFIFLLFLECNLVIIEDTYILYLFTGFCFFTGSLVVASSLVQFCRLRSFTCSWTCSCFLTSLFLFVRFCLLHLCKVGVLHRQLELFFSLCRVQVLHPQLGLWLCRSSLTSKFQYHSFMCIRCLLFSVYNLQVRMFKYLFIILILQTFHIGWHIFFSCS